MNPYVRESGVIDARVDEFRAILTACAAQGFDPALVSVTLWKLGDSSIHPAWPAERITRDHAVAILAAISDRTPELLNQHRECTSYRAGEHLLYARVEPETVEA